MVLSRRPGYNKMSGPEVLGAIVAAMQVLGGIHKFFGTWRNVPFEIERLREILEEMHDERLMAQAQQKEQDDIRDLIRTCTGLLQEGQENTWKKFLWPTAAEEQLRERNDAIERKLGRLQTRVALHPRWAFCWHPDHCGRWLTYPCRSGNTSPIVAALPLAAGPSGSAPSAAGGPSAARPSRHRARGSNASAATTASTG